MKIICNLLPCLLFVIGINIQGTEQVRPNVILVMKDDQGYGELSYYDNPILKNTWFDDIN